MFCFWFVFAFGLTAFRLPLPFFSSPVYFPVLNQAQ